jgi:thiamine transport system permease protein
VARAARNRRILQGFFLAVAASCFAVALASFVVPAFSAVRSAGVAGALPARILPALRFTLAEALWSSVLAIALGLPAAFLVARREFPGRRFLLALSGVPLCVPPMIIALAFVLFYGRQGYLNVFLMSVTGAKDPPVTFLYSFSGIVIAHGFYNFPVVLRTVSQVWERLPEAEEDAATLLGAGRLRVFRTVTLPRLAGAILSSGVLVFLYCFFSFIIVMTFGGLGGTSLEVELYRAARATLDFRMAGTIAAVESAAAIGIVVAYMALQKKIAGTEAGIRRPRPRKSLRGAGEICSSVAYLAFILVFFVGPLCSILFRSFVVPVGASPLSGKFAFGLDQWRLLLSRGNFIPALANTVCVAVPVAVVSTLAALFFALVGESGADGGVVRRAFALLLRVIPLSPLAVSSVMLGFGWMLLAPRGNALSLILAQSAMSWPFAWTQIRTALDRIPREVEEAALLLSPSRADAAFRVRVPLAWRGILSGAGFVFAISAGDASLPLVLSLGKFENLSLLLFRLAGSYRFSEACACAVVLALLCGFVFFVGDASDAKESNNG